MEGQTHIRTCSLADSYTLACSCIYFLHSICIYSNICGHTHTLSQRPHTRGSLSPCLLLTPGVLHVSAALVFLIPPSSPLGIRTERKLLNLYLNSSGYQCWFHSFLSLLQFLCITLDLLTLCLCFKHNCQATGIRVQLYYSLIIDHLKQRSAVRV